MTFEKVDDQGPPDQSRSLAARSPRVTLCVSGSIAAYKSVVLARELVKRGTSVDVVLTKSARQFVGDATFFGITGRPVACEMFANGSSGESHVSLASKTDLVVVAPATADLLARLAHGRADDLVTALVLCTQRPVIVAPAMHPSMWAHPATQRNVELLRQYGRFEIVGPEIGQVASGEEGMGRMSEPERLLALVVHRLTPKDFDNKNVVVTAGPTLEDLDPVRYLGNRSSGKMGFAIAERASARGARVTLIAGPCSLQTPPAVSRVDVRSALDMQRALADALGPQQAGADLLVMAAAVGDYRPKHPSPGKLKRNSSALSLDMIANPDLLAEIGEARRGRHPVLIGFAVETGDDASLIEYAVSKLLSKKVDAIVANRADEALGRNDNRAMLVTSEGHESLGTLSKEDLADRILSFAAPMMKGGR